MRTVSKWIGVVSILSMAASAVAGDYAVSSTLKIGGEGRWDYLCVDPTTHLLYVTRSNHEQVIDPDSGKVTADIDTGGRLHGTAIAPGANRGFVTDSEGACLHVFDLKDNKILGSIKAADDADGTIYDAGTDKVLVSCGDAGQLLVLDPKADLKTAKCDSVDLGGKPEFLAADGKGMAYVCLNDKDSIAVVDLKSLKVTATWSTGEGSAPTGLAIDAKNGRLFVGCRKSQKMVVLDTATGKNLAELPIGRGNDACAFDPGTGLAMASCGDSTTTIVKETAPGKFETVQTLKTAQGARTMTVDPGTHTLFLPTAEFEPGGGRRPNMKPGTFGIVVAKMNG